MSGTCLMSGERRVDPLRAALAVLGEPNDLVVVKCRALIAAYDAHHRNQAWQCVSVEEPFHVSVVNPNTGKASRTFTQAGRYDGIVAHEGRTYLLENKTTSDDIEDPMSHYWRRLVIDSQVSSYVLANWQGGWKLDGTLYDVVRKPQTRPKQITKALQRIMVEERRYYGFKIPESQCWDTEEGLYLYELRLRSELAESPNKFFQRRVIPRLDAEIIEYADELWSVGKSILDARLHNRHYRNSDACIAYGTPCEYLGVCSGHDSIDSDNWQRVDWVHEELPVLTNDGGHGLLTNSRVRCFQTCRRKHYFRYELGARKRDEAEREVLHFGKCWHQALAAWWSHLTERIDDDGTNNSAANEVASKHASGDLAEQGKTEGGRVAEQGDSARR